MDINFILNIIIVLIIVGFLYWAYTKLIGLATFLPPLIRSVIDVLMIILLVAIVLFYVIIPVIRLLGHIRIGQTMLPFIT